MLYIDGRNKTFFSRLYRQEFSERTHGGLLDRNEMI